MPVTYTIDADKQSVRTRCIGRVTLQEVIDHFRTLEQDPRCPAHLDVFLDLSGMDVSSVPQTAQLSRVVLEVKRVQNWVRFGACAILAPRDVVFGVMRMFETMSNQYFRVTQSFRDGTEAEVWLASQQSSADAGREDSRSQ
jgi:hypothetical protein